MPVTDAVRFCSVRPGAVRAGCYCAGDRLPVDVALVSQRETLIV